MNITVHDTLIRHDYHVQAGDGVQGDDGEIQDRKVVVTYTGDIELSLQHVHTCAELPRSLAQWDPTFPSFIFSELT